MTAMREIKFRGFNGEKWLYGDLAIDYKTKQATISDDRWWRHPVRFDTVGQFTGLMDADGREIYEGDVIRSDFLQHMRTDVCNGHVVYENGAFYVEYIDHTYANLGDLIFYSGTSTSVIGNVYDNPDLLEATE